MIKTIRDLVEGWSSSHVTDRALVEVARDVPNGAVEEHVGVSARMPGDSDPHPLGGGVANPMPGMSALALSRALRAGEIPFDQERRVRVYLDQYQKQSGELLYNPSHHQGISGDQRPLNYGVAGSLVSRGPKPDYSDAEDDFNEDDIEF